MKPKCLLFCALIFPAAILFSAAAANSQISDAKPKPNASVSGQVTIGDKPAPGIVVVATRGQNLFAQTVSDAEGSYHLNGLPAGQINVAPAAPVYVMPSNIFNGPGKAINLSANEALDGVDFKLTRGGVITGRVTSVDGSPVIEEHIDLTRVDENGQPIRVLSLPYNFQIYQTDDRGIYRIYGLAAGRYKVSVGRETGRGAELIAGGYYRKTYYTDVTDINKASIVNVSEGGEAKNIDVKLGSRTTTFTATGRIIDADTGQPLPGVQYSFGLIKGNQNELYVEGSSSPGTPTNAQGEFRLEGLEPGRYVVSVAAARSSLDPTPPSQSYSEPLTFEVIDSDVSNLEIKAQRALTLSGVVVLEGTADKNLLTGLIMYAGIANPPPVSGVHIMFGNSGSARVNPDGSFQIGGLSPGRAQLSIRSSNASGSPGFTISRVESESLMQTREAGLLPQIEIKPGHDVSDVRIYLISGSGVIRGQVKIEGGTLPNEVILFVGLMRDRTPSLLSAQVDSRGRFVIEHVPAGAYEAVLQIIPLGSPNPLPLGVPRTLRQPVIVTDNAETEITFTLNLTPKDGP